ncbi:MAG: peptidoglycan DD-metalloendopeptidase family protein [Gammaproteobacteria bacterium]|nr:peptidoglycan DD-metalloendopeptidase family protein [Gammaproteobacteria bacterium]
MRGVPPSKRRSPERRSLDALTKALLLAVSIHTAVAADEGSQAKAKLESVLAELNDLETWLSDAERRRLRWLKDVQVRDGAVARLSAAVRAGEAALADIRDALTDLEDEQQRLNAQREEEARRLANHLAAAYRLSGEQFVKLLFNQQSAGTLERILAYHRFITDARIQALDAFRRLSADIERNAEALRTQRAVERRDLEQLRTRRQSLQTERQARDALIAALDQEFEDKENRRTRLLADRQRLQTLIDQIERRTIPGVGRFTARKGSLAWPLRGELVGRFGQPRADGDMAWRGLLLNAPTGTEVAAVHGGRVVFADWLRGFGHMAIIDHGNGYMTLYGQADQLTKRVNDLVETGEVIAHAGQSGGATASGIYFELRHKGQAVDPWQWLTPP